MLPNCKHWAFKGQFHPAFLQCKERLGVNIFAFFVNLAFDFTVINLFNTRQEILIFMELFASTIMNQTHLCAHDLFKTSPDSHFCPLADMLLS